jgi:hypothetical protein
MEVFNSKTGVISKYISPPKEYLRSSFSIETIGLEYNMPAKYWFTNYALSHGYSLEAVTRHADNKIETIYIDVDGDTTNVVRMVVLRSGSRMVLVRYRVPMAHYSQEKAMQEQVLASFSLSSPDAKNVEALKTHAFLSESYFDYPETWTLLSKKVKSINRMQASLAQGEHYDKLDGQMSIFLASQFVGTSLKHEVRLFKEKLDIPGYELGKYIGQHTMSYHSDMRFGVTEVYEMTPTVSTQSEYELWVSVMQNDDYSYVVSLLTPSRKNDIYKWARNVDAYNVVISSMRRHDVNDIMFIQ